MRTLTATLAINLLVVGTLTGCGDIDSPTADQTDDVATTQSALATCGWGGDAWVNVGSVNSDNVTDIVSPHMDSVYRYRGTGPNKPPTFSFLFDQVPVLNQWGGGNYTWVKDFNGDGLSDIASASGGNVYMKMNTGSGFSSTTFFVPNSWGTSGYTFAGRFTNDNFADIATAFGSTINLFSSTGSSFVTITSSVPNQWGGSDYTRAGDFTGDGIMDIASISGSNVYMKRGSASGIFTGETWPVINAWGGSSFTFSADFSGDGKMDFASAVGGTVYLKTSTGNGFASTSTPVANQWGSSWNTACDLNHDGRADLVGMSFNSNSVYVKLATVTGGFDSQTWLLDSVSPWGNSWAFVSDFTGDGKCDIVTFYTSCAVKLYESTGSGFVSHSS